MEIGMIALRLPVIAAWLILTGLVIRAGRRARHPDVVRVRVLVGLLGLALVLDQVLGGVRDVQGITAPAGQGQMGSVVLWAEGALLVVFLILSLGLILDMRFGRFRRVDKTMGEVQRLRLLSRLDPATGLHHKAAFLEEIQRRCRAQALPVSVLLIDIDHFKSVNDTMGHLVGDQVIQGVAQTLMSIARDGDVAARFGGDEFALLLSRTDQVEAFRMAEIIRSRLDESLPLNITVSLGMATAAAPESCDPMAVLAAADRHLYMEKRARRPYRSAAPMDKADIGGQRR